MYHLINEVAPAQQQTQLHYPQQQLQPPQHQPQPQIIGAVKVQQQPTSFKLPSTQYRQNHANSNPTHNTHFQPPKPEQFFAHNNEQQLEFVNSDYATTPQEKYVMYLQQRIRPHKYYQQTPQVPSSYNHHHQQQQQQQQQQQHHQQPQTTYSKEQRDHAKQQYVKQHRFPQPIYVVSTPTTPVDDERPEELHNNYAPQIPVRHAAYQSLPKFSLPTNQWQQHKRPTQAPQKAQENVFNIPMRDMIEDLNVLRNKQRQHPAETNSEQNNQYSSALTPKYIEYIVDEPKQSLDEEQHQYVQSPVHPTLPTPQAAYIIISTSAQPYDLSNEHVGENYGSTVRPVHKQHKPTLRLQPVAKEVAPNFGAKQSTPAPTAKKVTASTNAEEDTKYVYVSNKPSYGQLLYPKPTTPIKLKPAFQYVTPSSLADHQTPKPKKVTPSHYQPKATIHSIKAKRPVSNYQNDPNQLPDIRTSSLAEILRKLQASNHLPHTLTPDNIDNSIKTLITILNNLKQTQTIVTNPSQHHDAEQNDYDSEGDGDNDYTNGSGETVHNSQDLNSVLPSQAGPNKHPGPSTGRPGVDYPNYAVIPQTSFDCGTQRYKGFFGDPETNCQVWHYCDLNGGKASFLCPNGTIFSQVCRQGHASASTSFNVDPKEKHP